MPFEVLPGLSGPLQVHLPPRAPAPQLLPPGVSGLLFAAASQAPATRHAQFLLSSALMRPSLLHGVTASQLFSDLGSHRASPRNASLASLTWTNCPGLGSPGPIYLCLYLFTINVCHHCCLTSVSSVIWRIVSVFTHDFVSQWFAQFCP